MELFTIIGGGFVLLVLFAAVVHALGTELGYKVVFAIVALMVVLNTAYRW